MGNRVARWVALLPLVLIGSMMFWSVALGLGGLSLLAVSGLTTGDEASDQAAEDPSIDPSDVRDVAPSASDVAAVQAAPVQAMDIEPVSGHAEPITVHIQPSAEPEDVLEGVPASVIDTAGVAAPTR
jgi:hypothetical protein